MNKYNAKKVRIDDITFDSKAEGRRYQELKLLLKAKLISNLILQPEFTLQQKYIKNGKVIQAIKYRADFLYQENGMFIVEDVKGMKTKDYKIKKKLFEFRYPCLEIREILG